MWTDHMEKHVFKVRYGLRVDGSPPQLQVCNQDQTIVFDTELTPEIQAMFGPSEYKIYIDGLYDNSDGMIYLKTQNTEGHTW